MQTTHTMSFNRYANIPLGALIVLYLALALLYVYATPIYEAPDELYHFALVEHVARTGELPIQNQRRIGAWKQEGSQPPLYYLLSAPLVRLFNTDDFRAIQPHNPHVNMGIPGAVGNKNRILHDAPYSLEMHGARAATYANRLISVLLGAVTVYAVYQAARTFAPNQRHFALLAAGLTAFNPQFLFITAAVNNDSLVTALNSLTLWQTLVMLRDGFKTRRSVILALLVALATLSKLSGLVMVVTVALAGLWVAYQRRDLRGLVLLGALMLGVWAGLAGWWYARNLHLYGELFGTNTMLSVFGRRLEPLTFGALLRELGSLRMSYWGVFGWFNVLTVPAFYVAVDALMVAALIGLALAVIGGDFNTTQRIQAAFLALTFGIGFAAFITWTLQTTGTQGRLLFPYMLVLSVLMAFGLMRLLRTRVHWLLAPMAVFAAGVPFITLIPTYQAPPPLDALPDSAVRLDAQFGSVTLLAYSAQPARYAPSDWVTLTLYWQAQTDSPRDYSMYVHLIDESSGAILTKLDTYPSLGRLRTTTWQVGAIYPDTVSLQIPAVARGAAVLNANVGLWDRPYGLYLDAVFPDGRTQSSVSIPLGAYSDGQPLDDSGFAHIDPMPRFGDSIVLIGWRWQSDTLSLLWEALTDGADDFIAMAVLLPEPYREGAPFTIQAQADSPPQLPTRFWRKGERYITQHTLQQPEGAYTLYTAWYSLTRAYRLPTGTPADMVQVASTAP